MTSEHVSSPHGARHVFSSHVPGEIHDCISVRVTVGESVVGFL